ncbi:hypothetical protein C8A05DRAFT_19174 [Staphylotrichum tortipilum]|uniref:Translation initiation factor IF-2, mitochondrial n=1 Tax=Staphylotrichum tortipilum TaxID=2831512 RepID=A0AAN6MCD7_9PEZI|nr:hypothetical protein C8A05DRAFT_19174 [Staphylotrichum longicolle]
MMRRGLWQQKQNRPAASLLCRFTYSHGPYTRAVPTHASTTTTTTTARALSTSTSTPSTRWHSARPGRTPCGRLSPSAGPQHGGLAQRRLYAAMPSWATQPVETDPTGPPELLPHEREVRERAAAARAARLAAARPPQPAAAPPARPAGPVITQPPRAADAVSRPPLPAEPASQLAAQPASAPAPPLQATPAPAPAPAPTQTPPPPKKKGPAWASAAPSWASAAPAWAANTPDAQPGPAAPDQGAAVAAQPADPLAHLLPHEREARERAIRERAEREKAASDKAAAQPADPLAYLLPHEREAREKAIRERAERERAAIASATQAAQRGGPSRPFAIPSQQPAALRQPPSILRQPPAPARGPRANFAAPTRQAPQLDPFAPMPRMAPDEGEWKNLARRDRTAVSGSSFSRPASRFAQSSVSSSMGNFGTGEEAWSRIEKAVEMHGAKEKNQLATADASTWSWADDYTSTRAPSQDPVAIPETPSFPTQLPSESAWHDTRHSRLDRHRRGDAVSGDRAGRGDKGRDKAKKSRGRPREEEEDDDWDEAAYEERVRRKRERQREKERQKELDDGAPTPILLPEFISVSNLAAALGQKVDVFIQQLEELGFEDVGKENILTGETAGLVAQEYGFDPKLDTGEEEDLRPAPPPADPSSLPLRPPVVTIMGHVDHGKTTLLDYLRKSSIVSQEHGGITQHIGAFSVSLSSGKQITFLDTPGHAAFLSMRQRGANVTDMVILVVAADDSVMPQTLEAIKHARAAKVPIIVAINKVDKPEANVDRVKSDLASHGVEIEDYGGDVQVVCVSGKTGQGMDDLEENILLLAEMLDIRAETDGMAEGWVLESTIKPIGRVATVLVKRGTLRTGDFIVAGRVHTKIRTLRNEAGVEVPEAPPGTAVEILGWKEPPDAGDQVLQAPDESAAKTAVHYRRELKDRGEVIGQMAQQEQERRERERERERDKIIEKGTNPNARNKRNKGRAPPPGPDAETLAAAIAQAEAAAAAAAAPGTINVPFVVKGDVRGSVEAVTAALLEQGNNDVRAKVLLSMPGQINESDVELAAVAGGAIVNFNNPVPSGIKRMANEAGVKILDHKVIYHLVEEVRGTMEDALPPLVVKKVVGEAEVLQIFPIKLKRKAYKNIAGCKMLNGYVKRGTKARVMRGRLEVFEGTIETLRHVKKEVDEMKKGNECGMSFAGWDELQEGDQIQFIEVVQEKRRL